MIGVIAEHIKLHRHELGKHALFIGSAVKIPPDDHTVSEALELMALRWAGDRVAHLELPQRPGAALELMATEVGDHAERCRLYREALGPEARPAEGHVRLSRLIKDGYYSTVMITEPDNMLERALHAQHMEPDKDYHLLVGGVDDPADIKVALAESSRIAIVKCGGDLERRFLPISPAELSQVAGDLHEVLADAFKVFSVFVAMTGRDDPFLEHIPREGGRIFWVNTMIPMADAQLYDELKLESPASAQYHQYQPHVVELLEARHSARHLLCREPGSFNEFFAKLHTRLVRQRGHRRGRRRDLTVLRGGPYRFLDSFTVEDADFYFGREDDVKAVIAKIQEHPLTVIFGKPAIGKTSLLRAGIMSALKRETEEADREETHPWLLAYTRVGEDPSASIRQAVLGAVEDMGYDAKELAQNATLRDLLMGAAELTGRQVVVLLDQFAEFFVKLGDKTRERFVEDIRACMEAGCPPVRLVIAIREDFLGELYELQDVFPHILHNLHRLHPFTREQAEDAILKPAQNFELQVERSLVHRIVEDLYRNGVEPVQLQIVCHSLYEARSPGSYVITERLYDKLGGAAEILDKYLERALNQLAVAERRIATKILTFVAGASELKAAYPLQRLVSEAGAETEVVERVLARLVDLGLLRPVGRGRHRGYELVHEILADKIQKDLAGKQVLVRDLQDLLTRHMNNATQFGLLISAEDLKLVGTARDDLAIGSDELALIIRSALAAEVDVEYWFGRVDELGDRKNEFLADLMQDEFPQVRLHTYRQLAPHLEPRFIRQLVRGLEDEQAEVRALAATYLGQLERPLVTMLQHTDSRVRALAARAIGHVKARRAVRPLIEALTDATPALRDEILSALVQIDDPRAPDLLLRSVSTATSPPWAAAHVLGRLSVGEEDLKALQRAARARRRPELSYALGIALGHRRNFAEAAEALATAEREAAGDARALAEIAEAQEQLQSQQARASAGEDIWPMFARDPHHRAWAPEQVTPPLELAWEFETKDHVVASPVVRDNTAYIGSRDKRFYAVDTGKGTARWSFEAPERIEGAAALWEDLVCFGTLGGSVHALHVASGEQQWRVNLDSNIRASVLAAHDCFFLSSRSGEVVCLSAEAGAVIWRAHAPGEISATAAMGDGLLVTACWDGHILALSAEDGREAWRHKTQAPVSSSPAIADGLVYCGSDDHGLYALDLLTGVPAWRADLRGGVRSSPAVGGDVVVVGSLDGNCYAVAREDGSIVWKATTSEEIMSSPAICGEVVYVGSRDGALYALNLNSGEVLWRHKSAYGIYSSPAIAEQTVFIGFNYYNLAAFRPSPRAAHPS